jgi:hypothetical protein
MPLLVIGLYAHSPVAEPLVTSVARSAWTALPTAKSLFRRLPHRLYGALWNAGHHGRQTTLLALWVMAATDVARSRTAKAFLRRAAGKSYVLLCQMGSERRLEQFVAASEALQARIAQLRGVAADAVVPEPRLVDDPESIKRIVRNDVPQTGHRFLGGLACATGPAAASIAERLEGEVGALPSTDTAVLEYAIQAYAASILLRDPLLPQRGRTRQPDVLQDDVVRMLNGLFLAYADLEPQNYRSHWGVMQFLCRSTDEAVYRGLKAGPRDWRRWRFSRTNTSATWPSAHRLCAFAHLLRWNRHRMTTLRRKHIVSACPSPIRTSVTAEHFNWAACSDKCRQALRFWRSKLGSTIRYRETHL